MGFWCTRYIYKSRKEHICGRCKRKILKKEDCIKESGEDKNNKIMYYLCKDCKPIKTIEEDLEWYKEK